MTRTAKLKAWGSLLIQICGGWLSIMSGALSIPSALLALYVGGSGKTYFWVLAFASLWGFAIGVTRKNYLRIKADESLLSLESIPVEMVRLPAGCMIQVKNKSRKMSANDVRVNVLSIAAPWPEFPFILPPLPLRLLPQRGEPLISIHPGAEEIFILFGAQSVNLTVPIQKNVVQVSFHGLDEPVIAFYEMDKDHSVKMRVTADNFPPTEATFLLNFKSQNGKCVYTLAEKS